MKHKKKIKKILIIIKNMKTSLKTGFPQIFSCCPEKMGGCSPPIAPLARTPPLTKLKKINSSSSNYVLLTF